MGETRYGRNPWLPSRWWMSGYFIYPCISRRFRAYMYKSVQNIALDLYMGQKLWSKKDPTVHVFVLNFDCFTRVSVCCTTDYSDHFGFGFTTLNQQLLYLICFYTEVKEKAMWISRQWSSVLLCIFFFWCLRFLYALTLVVGRLSHGDSCLCLCMCCHHCQLLPVFGDSDMTDL